MKSAFYSLSPLAAKKPRVRSSTAFQTPVKSAAKSTNGTTDLANKSIDETKEKPDNSLNNSGGTQLIISSEHTTALNLDQSVNDDCDSCINNVDLLKTPESNIMHLRKPRRLPKNLSTFFSPFLNRKTQKESISSSSTAVEIIKDPQITVELENLKKLLESKNECLRKLKMVKMYRTKNNLEELEILINKWRDVCQEGLIQLTDTLATETKPSLRELIDHLQIDYQLIKFNKEENDFT